MTRTAFAAEIARLENASPSRIPSFAEARAARLVELRALLSTLPADEPEVKDERLEGLLRRIQGGDRFGR